MALAFKPVCKHRHQSKFVKYVKISSTRFNNRICKRLLKNTVLCFSCCSLVHCYQYDKNFLLFLQFVQNNDLASILYVIVFNKIRYLLIKQRQSRCSLFRGISLQICHSHFQLSDGDKRSSAQNMGPINSSENIYFPIITNVYNYEKVRIHFSLANH